tara:strand:- start:6172 stop:6486 length:315 start_codon:yes stop_codon:yes gene_type:complete
MKVENMILDQREKNGRFAKGNTGGPGNPHAGRVSQLRSAILTAITPEDIDAIIKKLLVRARDGDLAAIKEILDRCIGKPGQSDLMERIETLEELAKGLQSEGMR